MNNRQKIIACEVVLDAMRPFLPEGVETETVPQSMHVNPKALRRHLQARIDASDGIHDPIVLGFGLCSQATVGLRAQRSRLVVARTDDCIGIFLGSKGAYRQQLDFEPGTYFLTRGWADENQPTPFNEFERVRKRWGAERAKRLLDRMLQRYRRLIYINTAGAESSSEANGYARDMADRFALSYEELEGKTTLIRKLIEGPWDDQCLVVQPGESIKLEGFMSAQSHGRPAIGR